MLISVPAARAEELLARLRENYEQAALIARVVERGSHSLVVRSLTSP